MNKKKRVVADINITPFTDVVLVLLIIFMITTPMLSQHEIKINLPKVAQNTERTEDKVIEIIIDKNGFIYINKEQVHKDHFMTLLKDKIEKDPNRPVIIKGDKAIKYDSVIAVMDMAKRAGVSRFGLAIDVADKKK